MTEELEEAKKKLKDNITKLITTKNIEQAEALLKQYQSMVHDDVEAISMAAVLEALKRNFSEAERILQRGLEIDATDYDLLFNLAYVQELQTNFAVALENYKKLTASLYTDKQRQLAHDAVRRLEAKETGLQENAAEVKGPKRKITFFVKPTLDSFLDDVIQGLTDFYETKKIVVTDLKQIEHEMKKADICWFEWCDELVGHASKLPIAKHKKIICRLHSYEAFTDYIHQVNWQNIDKLIFVAQHIRKVVLESEKTLQESQTCVIPNGVDVSRYQFARHKPGYNIAYVGYINYKKGPMLLLHTFKAIHDLDSRYKLYLAGQFQDPRDVLYFQQMIEEWQLQDSIIYTGWQDNLDQWLEDKNFILCTSILESQNMSVMQAMAKGIKPLVHHFVGAQDIYPKEYIWNSIDQCLNLIQDETYNSEEYRCFLEKRYSIKNQIGVLRQTIAGLFSTHRNEEYEAEEITSNPSCDLSPQQVLEKVCACLKKKQTIHNIPDVTLMITTYNRAELLLQDLRKHYKFGLVPKIIVDDGSSLPQQKKLRQVAKEIDVKQIVHHKKNLGVAVARQSGFKAITTKYLLSLDDDDMLFCLNEKEFLNEIELLRKEEVALIIPQYIVNGNEESILTIGYDRGDFHNALCQDVLKSFFLTGEMMAFHAGAIYNVADMEKCAAESIFQVSEDYVSLSRYFNKHLNQRVRVSNQYIYVRRVHQQSLSGTISSRNLTIHLLSLLVPGYYCLINNLVSKGEFIKAILERGRLLQKTYDFGEEFSQDLINYLTGKCDVDYIIKKNPIIANKNKLPLEALKIQGLFLTCDQNEFKQLPKVSIIITTYNRKHMLKDAIRSALEQDYYNLEIIVSDDASTDGTPEIVKEFLSDTRIKYNRFEKNTGFYYNHHHCVYDLATGDYALIMGDDDYFVDNSYISKAIKLILENPTVVLVHANCNILHPDGKIEKTDLQTARVTKGIDYFINYEQPQYGHICGLVTSLFNRKKAIEQGCFTEKSLAVDLLMYLKLMLVGDVGVVHDYVAVYRFHGGNLSNHLIPEYDPQTVIELEKVSNLAVKKGIPTGIMRQWINFRIFKYIRWSFYSYLMDGKRDIALQLLQSIHEKYPQVYQRISEMYLTNNTTPNEVFYNEEYEFAKKLLITSEAKFKELTQEAERKINMELYEEAAEAVLQAAWFAAEHHPGVYFSAKLEKVLLRCAEILDEQFPIKISNLPERNSHRKKRNVLHVLTEGYETGGHTRLMARWMERDCTSVHSVVALEPFRHTTPEWVEETTKKTGGWYYSLNGSNLGLCGRAKVLRDMAYSWADVVVLHIHQYDPIAMMAFGIKGGPPVIFLNHADHTFWLGVSIADIVANIRPVAQQASFHRRGCLRNGILPIPLVVPAEPLYTREKAKEILKIDKDTIVLLSIASAYKYCSSGVLDFGQTLLKIINKYPNVVGLVVGPDDSGKWEQLKIRSNNRIRAVGIQKDLEVYHCAADIYLDSFSLGSLTASLEAGLHKLPIVSLSNPANPLLSSNDESFIKTKITQSNVDDYIKKVSDLIENPKERILLGNTQAESIEKDHITSWNHYLDNIYHEMPKVHSVFDEYENIEACDDGDLYWAYLQNQK